MVDLFRQPLPLWDDLAWNTNQNWAAISLELEKADGFVFVTPELHGMASAALKNFLLFCTQELAHKPAMLVAVSASLGGAYPVAELRMGSYKNTRVVYIPDHIIVRYVDDMFVGADAVSDEDRSLRDRVDYSLRVLESYAAALRIVRASGVVDLESYPYGM